MCLLSGTWKSQKSGFPQDGGDGSCVRCCFLDGGPSSPQFSQQHLDIGCFSHISMRKISWYTHKPWWVSYSPQLWRKENSYRL
jgi:hypothetical protein